MDRARARRIQIVKQRLLRRGMPRLQVSAILLFTGLAGFLTSFLLLHFGLSRMWLRYPMAAIVAYCVFLLILYLWLWLRRGRKLDPNFDAPGLELIPDAIPSGSESFKFGGGGDFGGAAPAELGEKMLRLLPTFLPILSVTLRCLTSISTKVGQSCWR